MQMRNKVTGAGIFTTEELDAIDDEVLKLIDASVDSARNGPTPGADIMMSDVYIDY